MERRLSKDDRRFAEVLWNFHVLSEPLPQSVDLLLVTGSHDMRVADHAASLMLQGVAPLAITSGGFGKVTAGTNAVAEGALFRERMLAYGLSPASVLLETEAKNTGDNFVLSRAVLIAQRIPPPSTGLVVTKPYMERRAVATGSKQWPEVEWRATSPPLSFGDYPSEDVPEERMINLMVGDLQRLKVFADKGFQTPQEIPGSVWAAYDELVARGFDQYVIRE